MTANQLRYAELLETRAHNRETESQGRTGLSETQRHNKATEGIQTAQVAELRRHNVQTEGINWYSAQALANLQGAQEAKVTSEVGVQRDQLDETIAQNDASNALRRGELNEEREHHDVMENLGITNAQIAAGRADVQNITDIADTIRGYIPIIGGITTLYGG